uniref:Uncharacterized protein n=1 Tax=Sphaerodactylus townsendi TaxID=933632 RepID=A0ACB8EMD3_9SAUR
MKEGNPKEWRHARRRASGWGVEAWRKEDPKEGGMEEGGTHGQADQVAPWPMKDPGSSGGGIHGRRGDHGGPVEGGRKVVAHGEGTQEGSKSGGPKATKEDHGRTHGPRPMTHGGRRSSGDHDPWHHGHMEDPHDPRIHMGTGTKTQGPMTQGRTHGGSKDPATHDPSIQDPMTQYDRPRPTDPSSGGPSGDP